jgi:hypothetical protein
LSIEKIVIFAKNKSMKRIILSLAFSLMVVAMYAQCTPGSYTTVGIYPDTTTNLPQGAVNQSYLGVITAVVPSDTTIYGIPATIDSIGVTEVQGLPSGFAWAGNTPSAFFPGGTSGCIGIYGTPTTGQEGTYPLLIKILSAGKLAGMPTTLPDTLLGYKIVIVDSTHVGLVDSRLFSFGVKEIYPNPASTQATIVVTNNDAATVGIRINDMLGRMVSYTEQKINAGENNVNINVASLPEGVYFYTVSKGSSAITRKLIIER